MNVFNIIQKLLDEFEMNPYNTEYNITYVDAMKLLVSGRKDCVIFRHTYKTLRDNKFNCHYITFAIQHAYHKPLQCNLYLKNELIRAFMMSPNKIEWILNGVPLVLTMDDCFRVTFEDPDDLSEVDEMREVTKLPHASVGMRDLDGEEPSRLENSLDIEHTTYDMTFDIVLGRAMLKQDNACKIGAKYLVYSNRQYLNYKLLDNKPDNCVLFESRDDLQGCMR